MSNCPARAGFTGPRRPADAPRWDHPRSRGVYLEVDPAGAQLWGSSPLARGLHPDGGFQDGDVGIIPARAGFTRRRSERTRSPQDHPRSRGVYSRPVRFSRSQAGSSPLARGLRRRPDQHPTPHWDHPRSRGVYAATGGNSAFQRGSSPLARGLLGLLVCCLRIPGIIPARAGFTKFRVSGMRKKGDHPRSRGVYVRHGHIGCVSGGSSPLARGLQLRQQPATIRRRIIPARAGFTCG